MIDAKTIQNARAEAESTLDFRRQLKASDTLNELSSELFAEPNVQTVLLVLTDPSPLTVERLVEAGGKCVGDDGIRFGDLYFTTCEIEGIIGVMVGKEHLPRELWPRTVGHLRQLLLRIERQS